MYVNDSKCMNKAIAGVAYATVITSFSHKGFKSYISSCLCYYRKGGDFDGFIGIVKKIFLEGHIYLPCGKNKLLE